MLEETVQKPVDIQDKLMQHVSTVASTGEEMKREDKVKESKYSMSSKFYKEGWKLWLFCQEGSSEAATERSKKGVFDCLGE